MNENRKHSNFGRALKMGLSAFATLVAMLWLTSPIAAKDRVRLEAREEWSCFFGGQDISLRYRVVGDFDGRVSYSIAVQDVTVARRELAVRTKRGAPEDFAIRLALPEARPGTVIPVLVSVSIEGSPEQTRRLWVFPDEAFFNQRKLLEELQITLFDPDGKTARLFEQENIPFKRTKDADALLRIERGLVVVAEGVSFREYRSLPGILVKRAAEGVSVLCLAPSGGRLPIPGRGNDGPVRPTRLLLRNADVIHDFDKRLDARAWPPEGRVVVGSVVLTHDRNGPLGEIVPDDTGWPWLEADFASNGGRLVICGFGIVESWDSGPAPRYLLANLLKRMGEGSQEVADETASGKR